MSELKLSNIPVAPPATPSAGQITIYVDGGQLYYMDDSNTVTGPLGTGGGGSGDSFFFSQTLDVIEASGSLSLTGSLAAYFLSSSHGATITGSLINGLNCVASGLNSHAEGGGTTAYGQESHAEGSNTNASGPQSHAEGGGTSASGNYSHAEGASTLATNYASHAEGNGAFASGNAAHAEGYQTTASGDFSHSEGTSTIASQTSAHAEGGSTVAAGIGSHAEGSNTLALGNYSHAEGQSTSAESDYAHSEGRQTLAYGMYSHAEGYLTTASGDYANASGYQTIASGTYSFAHGYRTIASGSGQAVFGKYNTTNNDFSLFVIGDGYKPIGDGPLDPPESSDILRVNPGPVNTIGSGSVEVTGSLRATLGISGSLTQLTDGTSYLVAGDGITITSESNGPVTISQNEWMTVTLGHDTSTINVGNPSYFGQIYTLAATTVDPTTTANEYVFVSNVTGSIRKVSICSVSSAGAGSSKGTLNLKNGTQSTDKTVVSSYEHNGAGKYYNQVHVLTSSLDILPNDVIYFQVVNEHTASYTLKGVYNLLIQVTGTVWP